ncbi:Fic family protein [Yersinia pekkanenii]|uniref:Fic family protein n=1 Tax=Yersinia pekkanenii TaxID=1288385 RepID=A0A0T9R5P4_9GAMM|nr:Fic family protein [Yersinia pekkanenii]CNI46124.1 Fic family protein [Yersinia pekkanenii]CRY65717.1 Fic family protein [Yersinia pekkanenii]
MKMKKPDYLNELFDAIAPCARVLYGEVDAHSVIECGKLMSVVDDKGRYLHWADITKKTGNPDKAKALWSLVSLARKVALKPVPRLGHSLGAITLFTSLPSMQKVCSLIDRTCTEAGLKDLISCIDIPGYYLHDFVNEESIASSQLEGASTTRAAARKMLTEKRAGRNESEKMILGNRRLMSLAWSERSSNLTASLLMQFHDEATRDIDDDKYRPGQVRTTDDVWVEGRDGERVYTPPLAEELTDFLEKLIEWVNYPHEESSLPTHYLHPVIKACIIHFGLAFLHPFHDGNGRVARALFYWYMFKHGYDAFLYISVSQHLKEAPVQYAEAYLKTETDRQDVTYFVDYQCRILDRAVHELIEHVRSVASKMRDFDTWMIANGMRKKIPNIQQQIINLIIMAPGENLTIKGFAERADISPATARVHLEKLADAGILLRQGGGGSRPVYYTPKSSLDKVRDALAKLYGQ